jgi:hypothetical protein
MKLRHELCKSPLTNQNPDRIIRFISQKMEHIFIVLILNKLYMNYCKLLLYIQSSLLNHFLV